MMTLSSILMTKALIWGMAFIKMPMPNSPSSSAARMGKASLMLSTMQEKNTSATPEATAFPRVAVP